ncbi:hypothetical protein J1605_003756 [Eschrichtius robustus]|uniref:Fanconi anemia core complex-associated protein 100 n=1 Tax=Eschrichtius robustus TaxID=9764 RepID=A0AB34HNL8_ESCRO|nr:hypothetical protein J1605_003756 [Eschrichtius robustus]
MDIVMPLCLNKSRISELHCTHPWERLTQTQAAWGLHVSVLGQEASLCDPPSPLACEQRALGHVFTCGKGCAWHSRSTWRGTPSGQWGWVWLQRICSGGQEVQSPLFPQFICGHLPASWEDHLSQVICSFDQIHVAAPGLCVGGEVHSTRQQIQPPRKTLEGRLRSAPSARRRRVLTGRHPGEASVLARVREPARPSGARGKRDFGRVQWSPGGGRTSGETKALGLPVFGFNRPTPGSGPAPPHPRLRPRPTPGSGPAPAPATPLYGGDRAATWAAVKRRAPPRPRHRRCEAETPPVAGLPGDPTMAGLAPRVEYLAGFCCPLGGLAAGKPRVLCHGAEVFLSTGSELVYVYDREGRLLIAVYKFPGQVWHLELLALRRALYVLCAPSGIYCLSLDQASRSVSRDDEDDRDDQDSEDGQVDELPAPVIPVHPDTCVLPSATLHAFTVLDDVLITLAQGPTQWKVQVFERPCPGEDPRPGGQIGEVELSTCNPPAGSQGEPTAPRFLPVLCCASPPGSRAPHGHPWGSGGVTLEGPLFGLLFGSDASLLESPVILCGLPDGQLCCVVLKTLVTSRSAPGDPKALVKILHHLEEPVIFIGALRTELPSEDVEDAYCDCLVALGHHGRTLAIKASWDEAGHLVPELREYSLPGPVLCAARGRGGHVYHSTPSDLCVVDLAQESSPWDLTQRDRAPGGLPSLLCPASLSACSVVTLSVSSRAPEGGAELLALSAKGRLMTCSLDPHSETPHPTRVTSANAGQKIKELLSGIGTVSER